MPIEVPKESKVYTKVYDNFKGVDLTNDVSNVWYRRSPDGLNMMPDDAGNPYKRVGWKIELSSEEIKRRIITEIPTITSEITIEKTTYFELGGVDYILLFTNVCPVLYSQDGIKVLNTYLASDRDEYGDVVTFTTRPEYDFPPIESGITYSPNPDRSFFFEGNGEAGYYMFCVDRIFKIERYANETATNELDNIRIVEKKATPPTVIISADTQTGGGTDYEGVNLLSDYYAIQYYGNVDTVTLPTLCSSEEVGGTTTFNLRAYKKTAKGDWESISAGVEADCVTVTFSSAIPIQVTGEDNIKVIYKPLGASTTVVTSTSDWMTSTAHYSEITSAFGDVTNYSDEITFDVPNISTNGGGTYDFMISYKTNSTTWHDCDWGEVPSFISGGYMRPNGTVNCNGRTLTLSVKKTSSAYYTSSTSSGTTTRSYPIRLKYKSAEYVSTGLDDNEQPYAFMSCTRNAIFGNGIVSQVFFTASTRDKYNTRVWWSSAQNPLCFPDTNYTEVGSNDKRIMGLIKLGSYLAVVKQGSSLESSIHILYPTSFDDNTTYAEKQKVNGVGAICKYGFNVLNDEALFVSEKGIMAVDFEDEDFFVKDRSFFVNGKLTRENLKTAYSFAWKNMYILAVNNKCYILDGSQKNSWGNDKNNLVYECYYLENIPAVCFAKMNDRVYFCDSRGNLCRFKDKTEQSVYHDEYSATINEDCGVKVTMLENEETEETTSLNVEVDRLTFISKLLDSVTFTYTDEWSPSLEDYGVTVYGDATEGDCFRVSIDHSPVNIFCSNDELEVTAEYTTNETTVFTYDGEDWTPDIFDYGVTVSGEPRENDRIEIIKGVPINARWSTVADDDNAINMFKTMQKKGCVVSLLPSVDSGVDIYLKRDNDERQFICSSDAKNESLPTEVYLKKKVKKYKRLQIICENNVIDDSFGIDQITKCYTLGNYSKNRGGVNG